MGCYCHSTYGEPLTPCLGCTFSGYWRSGTSVPNLWPPYIAQTWLRLFYVTTSQTRLLFPLEPDKVAHFPPSF